MTRSQTVAITKNARGVIRKYEITDSLACNFFGNKEVMGTNVAGMAVNTTLSGIGEKNDNFDQRLDLITNGNADQKAAVLALLAKAEPGQEIIVSRELKTDSLFDVNCLLSRMDDYGKIKSDEDLKRDKSAADTLIDDPNAYVITAFSLTTVAKESDNSRLDNTVKGVNIGKTGIIDVTKTATGAHLTLETVHVGAVAK